MTYCTWTDANALDKEEADDILASKPGGEEYLAVETLMRGLFK